MAFPIERGCSWFIRPLNSGIPVKYVRKHSMKWGALVRTGQFTSLYYCCKLNGVVLLEHLAAPTMVS